jgi:hypothetical protein
MTPEGKVKAKVREIFKEFGTAYTHIPASQFGKAGVGDYICCVKGIYLEVEAKAGKGKQTLLQRLRANEVEEAGGFYVVINEDNLVMLKALLETLSVQTYLAVLPIIEEARNKK